MLQELATDTSAGAWAIGSMVFFLVVYVVVMVRLFRTRSEELEARARLVLDEGNDKA